MKKLIALVLALAMILMVGAVYADPDPDDGSAANQPDAQTSPMNNVVADTSVTVGGLENGDSVKFIRFIKWDANTEHGWKYDENFSAAAAASGTTLPLIDTITGYTDNNNVFHAGEISSADAAVLAKVAASVKEKITSKIVSATGSEPGKATAVYSGAPVGLYVALVTPSVPTWMYNPIFVAADYSQRDTSPNTQAATLDCSYSDNALAKKEEVTLTKEIDGTSDTKYDVNVGDEIPFTIESLVPAFSDAYQDPVWVLTDTLESGLEIQGTPTVTISALTADDYEVVVAENKLSFTVTMKPSGLAKVKNIGTAQEITVTYKAKIVSLDAGTVQVTEKKNTATVKFSNNPGDSSSYSLLEDKTRNYTFSIDANLLGKTDGSYETSELIKTGRNADGTWKYTTINYRSGTGSTELAPLEGAKFTLYKEDGTTVYKNTVFDGTEIQSDKNGRILIQGLDAGTYKLRETAAPTGFIKDSRTFTITISAEYETIPSGTYRNAQNILVKYGEYKVLKDYSVAISDSTNTATSSYTILNDATEDNKIDVGITAAQTDPSTGNAGDVVTEIVNTQGTELPSTGGIGTTIFYIVGGLLLVGAAVILVARRKAQE